MTAVMIIQLLIVLAALYVGSRYGSLALAWLQVSRLPMLFSLYLDANYLRYFPEERLSSGTSLPTLPR